jgi:glycosyltransferase involved in cell wall biosynthesis
MSLSVVIITLNAEKHIRACLESVKWAEEIVVLDSGSTDDTVSICREYTTLVHETDWPGFGRQKNRAIAKATQEWVLVLDADEYLSEELQADIRAVMAKPKGAIAFKLRRYSTFMGKLIRHGDWGKDWVVRLFLRGRAQYNDARVHENLLVDGAVSSLPGVLYHDTVTDIGTALRKLNEYSTLGAQQMQERGRQGSLLSACLHGGWSFCRCYLMHGGFLDGKEGYLVALLTAQASFYKYVKRSYLSTEA